MLYNEGFVFQKKLAAVMQYPQNTQKCLKKDEKNENALTAYYFLVLNIQTFLSTFFAFFFGLLRKSDHFLNKFAPK